MKNWKTTLLGILGVVLHFLGTKCGLSQEVASQLGTAAIGTGLMLAKDGNSNDKTPPSANSATK